MDESLQVCRCLFDVEVKPHTDHKQLWLRPSKYVFMLSVRREGFKDLWFFLFDAASRIGRDRLRAGGRPFKTAGCCQITRSEHAETILVAVTWWRDPYRSGHEDRVKTVRCDTACSWNHYTQLIGSDEFNHLRAKREVAVLHLSQNREQNESTSENRKTSDQLFASSRWRRIQSRAATNSLLSSCSFRTTKMCDRTRRGC
jgi:hypothetical protein